MTIGIMMMLAQQLSGINAIIFYSTSVFESSGLNTKNAQYATLGVGVANVIMTLVSVGVIEKAGRKTLLLIGLGGMLASTITLMACLVFGDKEAQSLTAASVIGIAAVILFVSFFAIGPGPIPWFFVSELFAQRARPAATSIAVGINWAANFIVSWAFQPLAHIMGPWVFLIFIVMQIIFLVYIGAVVPETKDKSIAEVAAIFEEKKVVLKK